MSRLCIAPAAAFKSDRDARSEKRGRIPPADANLILTSAFVLRHHTQTRSAFAACSCIVVNRCRCVREEQQRDGMPPAEEIVTLFSTCSSMLHRAYAACRCTSTERRRKRDQRQAECHAGRRNFDRVPVMLNTIHSAPAESLHHVDQLRHQQREEGRDATC